MDHISVALRGALSFHFKEKCNVDLKKIGINIEKELDKYVALVCWQLSFKIPLSVNLRSKSNFKIYNFPIGILQGLY